MGGTLGSNANPPTDEPKPDLEAAVRNLGRAVHGGVRSTLGPKGDAFAKAVKPHLPDRFWMKKIFMWLAVAAVFLAILGFALG